MKQRALFEAQHDAMRRRLTFLQEAVAAAVEELWRGDLTFAEAETLSSEVRAVQFEIQTLKRSPASDI